MENAISLARANPFLRFALIQPTMLEGSEARIAYDHRLFYILDGEGILLFSNEQIPLAENSLVLFPPGCPYYFKGKMRVAVLNFDVTRAADERRPARSPAPAEQFDEDAVFDRATIRELAGLTVLPDAAFLYDRLLRLIHAFDEQDSLADALTGALLKQLLAEIALHRRKPADPPGALVDAVWRYIRLYAPQIPDNRALAKHFGYHPVYLATLFREKTGQTLHSAILDCRLQLAKRLLTETETDIAEIAFSVGFSSRSHFSELFSKRERLSPAQYRKQHRYCQRNSE